MHSSPAFLPSQGKKKSARMARTGPVPRENCLASRPSLVVAWGGGPWFGSKVAVTGAAVLVSLCASFEQADSKTAAVVMVPNG